MLNMAEDDDMNEQYYDDGDFEWLYVEDTCPLAVSRSLARGAREGAAIPVFHSIDLRRPRLACTVPAHGTHGRQAD